MAGPQTCHVSRGRLLAAHSGRFASFPNDMSEARLIRQSLDHEVKQRSQSRQAFQIPVIAYEGISCRGRLAEVE